MVRTTTLPTPNTHTPCFRTNKKQTSTATATTPALTLSLLTSLGGVIGYARTGSIPSIAAGLTIGALYLYSYTRLRAGEPWGDEIALLASVVLGGSSVPRVIKTGGRKVVPVGLGVLAIYGGWVFGGRVLRR